MIDFKPSILKNWYVTINKNKLKSIESGIYPHIILCKLTKRNFSLFFW